MNRLHNLDQYETLRAEHAYTRKLDPCILDYDTGRVFDHATAEYGMVESLHDILTFIPEGD